MKRLILSLFLMLFFSEYSISSSLEGRWVQDVAKQMEFYEGYMRSDIAIKEEIGCSNQLLEFGVDTMIVSQGEIECDMHDGKIKVYPYNYKYYYRVLSDNNNTIVIEYSDSEGKKITPVLYHFASDDLMWTYYYGEDGADHVRLYFKRLPE